MSMKTRMTALATGMLLSILGGIQGALALDEVTVAYFLEWPTANQVAQMEKTYDKEMGVKLKWRAFGNGNEMTQAMVSGDVQIAYSQGIVPFVIGVSTGAPLRLVGIAVTYAESDNCIVHKETGITKANAKDLEGKKVATPFGNVTHYKLLRTLEHLGVDHSKVKLVQMNPPGGAVALARADVAMACGFGGALTRMREYGEPLMTGAELKAIGINTFDIVTVTNAFAEEHPDLVEKFMEVTEAANVAYKADPDAAYPIVANASGMDRDTTRSTMAKLGFPSAADQKGSNWLGGGVQKMIKGVADVMVSAGSMDTALDDYTVFIDPNFLK